MSIIEDSESAWEARARYRHTIIVLMVLYTVSTVPTIVWMGSKANGKPLFSAGDSTLEMILDGLALTHVLTAFFSMLLLLFLIGMRYHVRIDRSGITQHVLFGMKEHWAAEDISGIQNEFNKDILKKHPLGGIPVVLRDGSCVRVMNQAWLGCTADQTFDALLKHIGWADRAPMREYGSARIDALKDIDWFAVPSTGTQVWQAKRRTWVVLEIAYIIASVLIFRMCVGVLMDVEAAVGEQVPIDFEKLLWKCALLVVLGGVVGFRGVIEFGDLISGGGPRSIELSDRGITFRRTWKSVVVPIEDLAGVQILSASRREVLVKRTSGFRNDWLGIARSLTSRNRINEHRFKCKPHEITTVLLVRYGELSSAVCREEAKQWRATKKAEHRKLATTAETESD